MAYKYLNHEIISKIKQIEIQTRRLLRSSLSGDSRSALKGTGFEFDQIREYQLGDDVRFIDWNASSRMNNILVKQYIEERSRVVMLAVDVSGSGILGSGESLKQETIAKIASVLALVTESGKDRVGLMLFSDEIELYIPPSRGRGHIMRIMKSVFTHKAQHKKTNITAALKKCAELKRKDTVLFLISDFIDDTIDKTYLSLVAQKYDTVAVRCLDAREHELPAIGFIPLKDSETGEEFLLDARKSMQPHVSTFLKERLMIQDKLFRRYGIHKIDAENNDSFIGDIIKFFRRRMRY